jgi:hypothetical protein
VAYPTLTVLFALAAALVVAAAATATIVLRRAPL